MKLGNDLTFNPAYTGERLDLLSLTPPDAKNILDIGCSTGALGKQLKQRGAANVAGIEMDRQMAQVAETVLDTVLVGDIEQIDLVEHFAPHYFDCIILGDVLEHLRDPWRVLSVCADYLSDNGTVVASIPNVRHYSTIFDLLVRGYWPYRDRGIHDRTHLRFFTLRNIVELFEGAGLTIHSVRRKYRIIEWPSPFNHYARLFAVPPIRDLITFQFLIVAQRRGDTVAT